MICRHYGNNDCERIHTYAPILSIYIIDIIIIVIVQLNINKLYLYKRLSKTYNVCVYVCVLVYYIL